MRLSKEPLLIEVHYPTDERVNRFAFSPKVIVREMLQLGIPASLLFGPPYLIGIPRFILRFASDPVGYLIGNSDAIGPFVPYLYDPNLGTLGTWILCYIFFSVFAAVCWHYRYKLAFRIADVRPEEFRALQESLSHQHMTDLRRNGATGFSVERYEPQEFFALVLIREFRSRKSLFRYMPFFRSWMDFPIEGSIGSVFSRVLLAIALVVFATCIYGLLVILFVFTPIVLASSLLSFAFVWAIDISSETRAVIALMIAYAAFVYLWTSLIAAMIGRPYVSSKDIQQSLEQRTGDLLS